MTKYHEIDKQHTEKLQQLMNDCGIFWAFSNEQFNEGKTPLQPGDKYVSIGAGGYMPKSKVETFIAGQKELSKWKRNAIKAHKAKEEHILYELNNHECFYTGSISDALRVLEYSIDEVMAVYRKYEGTPAAAC